MKQKLYWMISSLVVFSLAVVYGSDCFRTSVGLIPLIDGPGLYSSGLNTAPPAHIARGQAIASALRTLPRVALMSVGMSNTNQYFEAFRRNEETTTDKASNLRIINGATGKQASSSWANPNDDVYGFADEKIVASGATPLDVRVLWVLSTNGANGGFPYWRERVKNDTREALYAIVDKYPNVQLIFISSMIYGGYNTPQGGLHPEPYSHEHGIVMKELITEHLKGTLLPDRWIAWGPYMWTDGVKPRSDGLIWLCGDFVNDGCHPSLQGAYKVGGILSSFFRTDPVAKIVFTAAGGGGASGGVRPQFPTR